MGAWKTIRNGLLIGLLLFVLFSRPFLVMAMLSDPLQGDELEEFADDYGIRKPFISEGRAGEGTTMVLVPVGAQEVFRMLLDRRVIFIVPPLGGYWDD